MIMFLIYSYLMCFRFQSKFYLFIYIYQLYFTITAIFNFWYNQIEYKRSFIIMSNFLHTTICNIKIESNSSIFTSIRQIGRTKETLSAKCCPADFQTSEHEKKIQTHLSYVQYLTRKDQNNGSHSFSNSSF